LSVFAVVLEEKENLTLSGIHDSEGVAEMGIGWHDDLSHIREARLVAG